MSVNLAIFKLLNGATAKSVVEDLDKASMSYAAAMIKQGMSEKEAVKRAVQLTGHEPDDEMLHIATKNSGEVRPEGVVRHWMKQGHYDPTRTPLYLDAAGNSIDD